MLIDFFKFMKYYLNPCLKMTVFLFQICRMLYLLPLNVENEFGNLDSNCLMNSCYVEMIMSKRRQDDEVQVKLQRSDTQPSNIAAV